YIQTGVGSCPADHVHDSAVAYWSVDLDSLANVGRLCGAVGNTNCPLLARIPYFALASRSVNTHYARRANSWLNSLDLALNLSVEVVLHVGCRVDTSKAALHCTFTTLLPVPDIGPRSSGKSSEVIMYL